MNGAVLPEHPWSLEHFTDIATAATFLATWWYAFKPSGDLVPSFTSVEVYDETVGTAKGTSSSGNQVVNMSEELLNKSLLEDGANMVEKVGNYKIYGNKGLVGDTYTRNVLLIETDANATKSLSGFKTMVQQLENEAKAAGASKISIGGYEVYNQGFLSPSVASKMGYKMEVINNSTVILTKELK